MPSPPRSPMFSPIVSAPFTCWSGTCFGARALYCSISDRVQGSKYDGDGRLTDWWSAADRQAFETRTRSLIEQYNALAPKQVPDQHVNGALTIGENIGDLGGVGIAWQAYLVSLHGEP